MNFIYKIGVLHVNTTQISHLGKVNFTFSISVFREEFFM